MEESETHLLHYLKVIYTRKWLILVIMIMSLAFGVFRVHRAVPVYQSYLYDQSGRTERHDNPWWQGHPIFQPLGL